MPSLPRRMALLPRRMASLPRRMANGSGHTLLDGLILLDGIVAHPLGWHRSTSFSDGILAHPLGWYICERFVILSEDVTQWAESCRDSDRETIFAEIG